MTKQQWIDVFKARLKERLDASTKAIVDDAAKVEYDYNHDNPRECADEEFDALCDR